MTDKLKSYYLSKNVLNKMKFKSIGKNCKISNLVSFIGIKNISIEDNVRIDDFTIINAFEGSITIKKNTNIGSLCYLLGSSGIEIGNNCRISQGVKMYSKSDEYKKIINKQTYKKIVISDNVIIGSSAILLPGSLIEKNCRIGALTIVKKKIKKNTLFFGKTSSSIS